ncbi:protein geranylgeranyltransferase type II, alpha subunit, putative [Plasmodium sp. DRC-Itaito]|nr:protein geranylgeranyltransferase type II, alpha subunit, putative [Plasmodium sp. DRC-Itaito]
MENRYLYEYKKKFGVSHPEILDEEEFESLNYNLFHMMEQKKFVIDIKDIEEDAKKYLFDEKGDIKNKEKISIINTYYSDRERMLFSLLSSLIEKKEYSFEGYIICSYIIKMNSSYYSAWVYRRKCLKKLNLNLLNDLKFTKHIISDNIKSFQSWFHRRWLIEYIYKMNCRKKNMKSDNECNYNRYIEEDKNKDNKNENINEYNIEMENNYIFVFDDEKNFISSEEEMSSDSSYNIYDNFYNDDDIGFISNCDDTDFEEGEDNNRNNIYMYEELEDIINNNIFFKNSLLSNEIINIDNFLYEELLYNNCDLFIDMKNYNSWATKTWLIDKFNILQNEYICKKYNIILHEFCFINYLLSIDIYNNSLWVYRYFILNKLNYFYDITKMEKEINFCFTYANQFYDNQAIFNYFIHMVFIYINLYKNGTKGKKKNTEIYKQGNILYEKKEETYEHVKVDIFQIPLVNDIKNELIKIQDKSKFVLVFLSQLYAYNGSYDDEIECYRYLEKYDDFNEHVWKDKIECVQKKLKI